MISRMLLTLSGPCRKNATMRSHNSTQNQYIMQRATFFQGHRPFATNFLHFCCKTPHKSLWFGSLEMLHIYFMWGHTTLPPTSTPVGKLEKLAKSVN